MFPFEISIIMLKIPKYVFFKRNYYYTQKINKTKKNNTVVLKIIVPSLNERVLSWLLLLNLTIITSVPPTTSFRCNVFTSKIRLQFNTDTLLYFKHTTHCFTLKRNILSCEQEMLSSPTLKENRNQSKISLIKWFMLKTFEVWDIYLLNRVSWQKPQNMHLASFLTSLNRQTNDTKCW